MFRWSLFLLTALPLVAAELSSDFFEAKVRPVLAAKCYGCHGEQATAGLRVDSRERLLKGGKSGPAIVIGDPQNSFIIQAITGTGERMAMPPTGLRLESHEVESLSAWIEMGAPWPLSPREFFAKKIQPLLAEKCLACHVEEPKGGLRLDTREALLKGGKSGPAIVPGDSGGSLLIQALGYAHALKMPPMGALPAKAIADFKQWVDDGAAWSDVAAAHVPDYVVSDEHRAHWSFQPLSDPAVPHVEKRYSGGNAVDQFILSKLQEMAITPSPLADKRTLIRRLTYDLTGLPASPAEVDHFLNDDSPESYENLVERLLDSRIRRALGSALARSGSLCGYSRRRR